MTQQPGNPPGNVQQIEEAQRWLKEVNTAELQRIKNKGIIVDWCIIKNSTINDKTWDSRVCQAPRPTKENVNDEPTGIEVRRLVTKHLTVINT